MKEEEVWRVIPKCLVDITVYLMKPIAEIRNTGRGLHLGRVGVCGNMFGLEHVFEEERLSKDVTWLETQIWI